ncbi:GtrA family protein [Companilactobacillus nuruki]|uniref:Teichoic acid glycosylation protein n=1 Tax=Companilactobacillus nuruki TaxID=1993540 RepID=A0A2N7AXL4_9LACO|nr:GtrA family protein [Companilactobacillus nuruki]PMD73829.1 teichoic acid glycosylation protein [Companilactobacillus nuruki]
MNKKTDLNEEGPITKIIDDVAEGINDAAPTYQTEEELPKYSNGKEAVRYLLWGLLSVIVNFSLFFLLYHTIHLNYQLANIIAWFFAVQTAFWVDRIIVFHHKSATAIREMLAFYGTRVLTYLIESATLWVGISIIGMGGTGAKVVGQLLAIIGNYILSKFFIFKNKR